MRFAFLVSFAVFAAAVTSSTTFAAGPDPAQIYVQSISYGGNGCPQGSVGQSLSDDRSTFTLIFDSFVASSGPGIPLTEARKNCQINVNLHIPQGWSLAIANVDYRGYVQLPAGVSATQRSTYNFYGELTQASANTNFVGPVSKDYLVRDSLALASLVWSSCNAVNPLNINTTIRLNNPSPTASAQITTDSVDGKIQHILGLQWRQC